MRLLFQLYLMHVAARNEERHKRTSSRYQKSCRFQQSEYERYIRQRHIPRHSLLPVSKSPWRRVYSSQDDQAMITLTGFDVNSFHYLCSVFAPIYETYSPFVNEDGYIVKKRSRAGRPRHMRSEDCLGLVLAWTRTRGSLMVLQLIFGTTMTPTCKYLQFARRILVKVLRNNEYARIVMPSAHQLEEYRQMIASRHPALVDVWSSMDGLKVRIEQAPNFITQSRFYNGWKCDHFVTSVLCFAPDGTIPAAYFNVPGCTHDSTVAEWGNLYEKMEGIYNEFGLKSVIDSAFSSANIPFLIKSSQDFLTADSECEGGEVMLQNLAVKRQATSMRQSSEWGMRAVQSSFPRLKDVMPFEEYGERRITLTCLFLLFNCRARLVGINQIRNVYFPSLNKDANVDFLPRY